MIDFTVGVGPGAIAEPAEFPGLSLVSASLGRMH